MLTGLSRLNAASIEAPTPHPADSEDTRGASDDTGCPGCGRPLLSANDRCRVCGYRPGRATRPRASRALAPSPSVVTGVLGRLAVLMAVVNASYGLFCLVTWDLFKAVILFSLALVCAALPRDARPSTGETQPG